MRTGETVEKEVDQAKLAKLASDEKCARIPSLDSYINKIIFLRSKLWVTAMSQWTRSSAFLHDLVRWTEEIANHMVPGDTMVLSSTYVVQYQEGNLGMIQTISTTDTNTDTVNNTPYCACQ